MDNTPTAAASARFVTGPWLQGMGHTLGQALQQVLRLRTTDPGHPAVRRADASVQSARQGQPGQLERLVLRVQTDASLTPQAAIAQGAERLIDQLAGLAVRPTQPIVCCPCPICPPKPWPEILQQPLASLALSVRAANSLRGEGIHRIGELVRRTALDLLRAPNLGRKSLVEIQAALAAHGLVLGTALPGWTAHPSPGPR